MRPGVPAMACWLDCSMRPAVTIEPPDGSSTVVVLLRGRKPLSLAHTDRAVTVGSGSVTSVAMCREMRPSDRTVGVKLSVTP